MYFSTTTSQRQVFLMKKTPTGSVEKEESISLTKHRISPE